MVIWRSFLSPFDFFVCLASFCIFFHPSTSSSGILTGTWRTFQEASCDGEPMKMSCPPGMLVSIQFAQYGRQVPSSEMCPSSFQRDDPLTGYLLASSSMQEDTNCLATTSLKVILEACQDKQQCNLVADTKTFQQDPCPGTRKYLEVEYKCRPNQFSSETVCEGDQIELRCSRSTRIAISSGLFGRTPLGDKKCPELLRNTSSIKTTCQSEITGTELMHRCHGRKQCTIEAEEYVFGDPCPKGVNKYLNIVYTCVPKHVLIPFRHLGHRKKKKLKKNEDSGEESNKQSTNPAVKEYSPSSFTKAVPSAERTTPFSNETSLYSGTYATGLITDWLNTLHFIQENREKAILYMVLGFAFGIISILSVVTIRLNVANKEKPKVCQEDSVPEQEEYLARINYMEEPILSRTDSTECIEIVRFNPMQSRDFATCTLRRDYGDRSLANYYG